MTGVRDALRVIQEIVVRMRRRDLWSRDMSRDAQIWHFRAAIERSSKKVRGRQSQKKGRDRFVTVALEKIVPRDPRARKTVRTVWCNLASFCTILWVFCLVILP